MGRMGQCEGVWGEKDGMLGCEERWRRVNIGDCRKVRE